MLARFAVIALALSQPGQPRPVALIEAVRSTLEHDPAILLKRQDVVAVEGDLDVAHGDFDSVVAANLSHDHEKQPLTQIDQQLSGQSQSRSDVTDYKLGLTKKLGFGTVISPSVEVTRTELASDPLIPGAGGPLAQIASRSVVAFQITQPLLRGRGSDAVQAGLFAAEHTLNASRLDLRQAISVEVLKTVQAYWHYLSAIESLEALRDSEQRGKTVVGETEILIKAEERPMSDLRQLQASLADRTAARIQGEAAVVTARTALGLSMGLNTDAIGSLGAPADKFPEITAEIRVDPAVRTKLLELAVASRADLGAAKERLESNRALLVGADNAQYTQLDLSAALGYGGLSEGGGFDKFFTPLGNQISGPELTLGAAFSWPIENRAAHGAFRRQQATVEQGVIGLADLARQIGSAILVDIDAVERGSAKSKAAFEAVRLYDDVVNDERKKLGAGLSTVIDLILTQDRRTTALLTHAAAREATMTAIAQLRFDTATLLGGAPAPDGRAEVSFDQLIGVPKP
jgi:outer membrane protein TolC